MAKPKADAWLREAFRDGIDEREMVYRDGVERFRKKQRPYAAANPWCWLAQFDPKQRPCGGQPGKVLERFHFLRRQTVEEAVWTLLRGAYPLFVDDVEDAMLLAAWDPRNGGFGCEWHHRRYDGHACSPTAPQIEINYAHVPDHVIEFAFDWGLEGPFEDQFGVALIGVDAEPQPRPPNQRPRWPR